MTRGTDRPEQQPGGEWTWLVHTPSGPARAHHHRVAHGRPRASVVLGHGVGRGVDAPDLAAIAADLPGAGIEVVLVEQPWHVQGRRLHGPVPVEDPHAQERSRNVDHDIFVGRLDDDHRSSLVSRVQQPAGHVRDAQPVGACRQTEDLERAVVARPALLPCPVHLASGVCEAEEVVPIRVPADAYSSLPEVRLSAPVKAPFSYPNSSDSTRPGEMAAQLTGTKRARERGLARWINRAISSLPVPDSPAIRTAVSLSATREASPMISDMAPEP